MNPGTNSSHHQDDSEPGSAGTADRAEQQRLAAARRHMVATQIQSRGIDDRRVLEAMAVVPREEFVAAGSRGDAHSDWALPIGHGQTISQPFTVAFMVSALELRGDEQVLEVGTGSGYGAAVLSRLVREVHSIERFPTLAQEARRRLARLGFANVHVHLGDGSLGLATHAPFDAICVTAAAASLPPALADQLADGGRIVIPLGARHLGQRLVKFTRIGADFVREDLGAFGFVPLVGAQGWPADESGAS